MAHQRLSCWLLILLLSDVIPMASARPETMESQSYLPEESVTTYRIKRYSERDASQDKLGQGFYLPERDILGNVNGGQRLFASLQVKDCVEDSSQDRRTHQSMSYYRDTNAFYREIAVNSDLSAKLQGPFTMGRTLDTKSKSMSTGSTEISGLSLDIFTYTSGSSLKKECYSSGSKARLDSNFVKAFKALPKKIGDPSQPNSWLQYKYFLQKYGSHFLTEIKYGARLQQWTFAKSDKKYTEKEFALKACTSFEGPTKIGKLSVDSCTGYTKKDAQQSTHFEMSSRLDIKGGTDDTRNKLRGERSSELITELLNEGREHQTPVDYKFKGIWEMLKLEFPYGDAYHAVAVNLQQYYEGFLEFGCNPLKSNNNKPLRWFALNDDYDADKSPAYKCVIEKEGCHSHDDCHIGGAGSVSYCYGSSCVEHLAPEKGSKATNVKIRYHKSDDYDSGINNSCYFEWFKGYCSWSWSHNKVIWP